MFKSISLENDKDSYKYNIINILVDDDINPFIITSTRMMDPLLHYNVVYKIHLHYTEIKDNPISNLALYFKFIQDTYKINFDRMIKNHLHSSPYLATEFYNRHLKDLQKYITLF